MDEALRKLTEHGIDAVKDKNGVIIYKPYTKTIIEGVHVTAGMIFKYAIREKMRKDNPCIGAVIPVKKIDRRRYH